MTWLYACIKLAERGWVKWHTPVGPALGRLSQLGHRFAVKLAWNTEWNPVWKEHQLNKYIGPISNNSPVEMGAVSWPRWPKDFLYQPDALSSIPWMQGAKRGPTFRKVFSGFLMLSTAQYIITGFLSLIAKSEFYGLVFYRKQNLGSN